MISRTGKADLLRPRGRDERRADHRLARDRAGVQRRRPPGVLVHQAGQQFLIERAPVGPDAHRLAVADGDLDDQAELQVALRPEADVAGIDAVLVERLGAGVMVGEQLVADVVEVADQRNPDADRAQSVADMRHGGGGLVAVDGQAHEFRAGAGERRDLPRRRLDVGGVGVGHRLDDDRRAAAHQNGGVALAYLDADAGAARKRAEARLGRGEVHQNVLGARAGAAPVQEWRFRSRRRICHLKRRRPSQAPSQCNMTVLRRRLLRNIPFGDRQMSLAKRHAVVTGSTSGIGLAIARALAKEGADVMINGFGDAKAIEAERAGIEKEFGVRAFYNGADMSKGAEAAALIADATAKMGTVDILVNNAGIQFVSPIEEFPPEKWDAILAINLSSAFHTIRASVPGMKAQKWGRIINTASAHSLVASPFKSAYVSAKHGLAGLTKTVALELATFGVTCNCVSPGYVWTPLVENQIPDTMKARNMTREQVIRDVMLAAQPTKQFVTVDQVASLVVYLCSDMAAQITGSNLSIDGGFTAQ